MNDLGAIERTSDANTVNVIRDDALAVHDVVHLGSSTMENDRIKTDTVQKAQTESQFIQFREYGAADFDNRKLGRLRGVR